jgi:predicted GIY-YIG superfamily endonuclease
MHSCYIIYDVNDCTYNGYTVNFARRIRQHNKEIKGGARFTSCRGPWSYLVQIESEQFTKNIALSFEWSVKYPTNKRPRPRIYNGAQGRLQSLPFVFANPKFKDYKITVKVIDRFYDMLTDLCKEFPNVTVLNMDNDEVIHEVIPEETMLHQPHSTSEDDV